MRTEAVISISDLRYVCIECPQCRTKVILDMTERTEFGKRHDFFAPNKCPACQAPYDTAIQPGVDQLQKAYEALAPIAGRVSFRSEAEDDGRA